MIVWKVVQMPNRTSYIATGKGRVKYRKGRKTFARVKGTPLFAYNTKEAAEKANRLVFERFEDIIIKCEARRHSSRKRFVLDVDCICKPFCTDVVKAFWLNGIKVADIVRIPWGTILCEWIRPLE